MSRPVTVAPRIALAAQAGSGLIIALWVIALLSLLISAFAFDMNIEARVVSYCRKRLKAEYLARAGVERAKALLLKSTQVTEDKQKSEDKDKPWYDDAVRLRHGKGVRITDALGAGQVTVDIAPEPARRNINALKDEDWERIFKIGGVPEELWSGLIDSFNDWRDMDDQPRLDGAETEDYYARLNPPYKARGHSGQTTDKYADLDTVDELLLIKGFTHEILYGGRLDPTDKDSPVLNGIADLLTATPNAGVNVNAAPKRVLMTLPGINDTLADDIITEREGLTPGATIGEDHYFKDSADFLSRFPELNQISVEDRNYLTDLLKQMQSQAFRMTVVGAVQGVERRIACVVQFNQGSFTVLRWTEQER